MKEKKSLLRINMRYEEPVYGIFENHLVDMLAAGVIPSGDSAARISSLDPNVMVFFDVAEQLQSNLYRATEETKMTYLDRISSFDIVVRNIYVDVHGYIAKESEED